MASEAPSSLQRRCEPELMLDPAQVAAYADADFAAGDDAVVQRLAARWQPPVPARLIDLGCGPGNISFRLRELWPDREVVGVDGSATMLVVAGQRLLADGGSGLLTFVEARLPFSRAALDLLAPPFDAVVSNSLLHHLHDPRVFWRAVVQLAAPGSFIQMTDLRRPADEPSLQQLLRHHGACMPAVLRRDYGLSLRAAFTPGEIAGQLRDAGLTGLEVTCPDDQHLEVWGHLGPARGP
jgi:trans-aconitate 2-methyltransferase